MNATAQPPVPREESARTSPSRPLLDALDLRRHGGGPAGWLIPGAKTFVDRFTVGTTNIPIAIGLILMMYPPFAKVRYEEMGMSSATSASSDSPAPELVIGPFLMFFIAIGVSRDYPPTWRA